MFWWGVLVGELFTIACFSRKPVRTWWRTRLARRRLTARGFHPVTAAHFARIGVALDIDPDVIIDSSHNHWSDS